MTLAHRLTRRVSFELGGKSWPILFTHAALLDIEAITGLDIMAGELDLARPTARVFRDVLFTVLRSAGYQGNGAKTLLHPKRMPQTRLTLWNAWSSSMPEPENPEEGKEAGDQKLLSWIEAWAIADQDLGLGFDEWLSITPRMAQELQRRRLEMQRQWELMFGMVIANNANFSFCAPKRALRPRDFMLHPWSEETAGDLTGEYFMKFFSTFKKK